MPAQPPSKEFTWNNPASLMLRACDIAEIKMPTEVVTTLRGRARKYREITRVGSGPVAVEDYTIALLDEPTVDQAVAGGSPAVFSQAAIADIQRLNALGVHRNRLAELYNVEVSELDAILPVGIPTYTSASGTEAGPAHLSRSIFCLDRALSQRLKFVREWTPPAGVERDILLSFDHGRLVVELKYQGHTTRVVVLRNDRLAELGPRLDVAASSILTQAQSSYHGPTSPLHHGHSMPPYQYPFFPRANLSEDAFNFDCE